MTTTIDREIVQMEFDYREFQKGVQASLREIETLKKGLDLGRAQQSFAELEKASRINFSPLLEGISAINSKLSLVGVAAATVVSNITTSIINNVKKLFEALIVSPVTTGLQEYETQLNAVQTILANTSKQGTTLDDVNNALDELNRYADKTIYNFTQMTDSIGKFTTAGVDLETSVAAIKGIANLAAVSGSNAQQASTAMYQLSQAISSGTVKLQDWNSVVNAGLGGQVFQDSLIETAKVHGVAIDRILQQEGGFRGSLQRGWLSSEILLETLSKFTGDLTDDQLLTLGYTEEQIIAIQKMAETANDAATKIKTLTQLKDTLSEALQSGWAETWRIIFGDFEEAKNLWGRMGDLFGDLIGRSSEARNSQLEFWKAAGGRETLIKGVFNTIQALVNILRTFGQGITDIFKPIKAGDLITLTRHFFNFALKLKMASENSDNLRSIIRGLAAIIDIAFIAIKAILKPILTLLGIMSPAADGFVKTAVGVSDAIVAFREFAKTTGFFDTVVAKVIERVGEFIEKVKELVAKFVKLDIVKKVVAWFKDLERPDFIKIWNGILTVVKAIIAPFYLLAIGARNLYLEIAKLEIIRKISEFFKEIDWEGIKNSILGLGDGFKKLINSVKESELLAKFITYLKTFDGRRANAFFRDARENFAWLGNILDGLKSKLSEIDIDVSKVMEGIRKVASSIGETLGTVFDYLIENAGNVDYDRLFDIINAGLLSGVLISIRKVIKGGFISNILERFFGEGSTIQESVTGAFGAMESTLVSFQNNIKADTLQKIAIAIGILALSVLALSFIPSDRLLSATAAVAAMVAALFGATGALRLINTSDAAKATITMLGLSISMVILASALERLSGIEPSEIENSLLSMATGISALVIGVRALSGGTSGGLTKTVGTLLGLAIALEILSGSIIKFGVTDPEILTQGLLGVAASLGILVTSMLVLSKAVGNKQLVAGSLALIGMATGIKRLASAVTRFGEMDIGTLQQGIKSIGVILLGFAAYSRLLKPEGMLAASIAIVVMSGALVLLSVVVDLFAKLKWENMIRGLTGMAASLLIMALAANAMTGAVPGALATIVMTGALVLLAGALKLLSTLSWDDLLISLAAIAGVFVVLGLAGLLLTPVVPTLLLLGAAMALIGVGAALFGVGLLAASAGLVAIAGSAVAIAAAIGLVGGAIIEILPRIGAAIAAALVGFLVVIGENTPIIIEAMKKIIIGIISGITELMPEFLGVILTLITGILTTIADALPDIIQAGYDILLSFIQGIEDNIGEVVSTALGVIAEFIGGIADGIPDIVASAFDLLLAFLDSIADNIELKMPEIIASGLRIGQGIVDGVIDAIVGGAGAVWDAITGIAGNLLDGLKKGVDSNSPSRETYKIAKDVIAGFVNGITDGMDDVRKGVTRFSQEVQNGIAPLIDAITSTIDEQMTFSPKITPVLDLGKFNSKLGTIDSLFTNASVLATVASDNGREAARNAGSGQVEETGKVVFNQYNYSPKALDRNTIYRQTKTQVAQLERRELQR